MACELPVSALALFDSSSTGKVPMTRCNIPQWLVGQKLMVIRLIQIVMLSIVAMSAAGSFRSCCWSSACEVEKGERVPGKTIEQLLNEKTDEWMAIPGVEGTAIGIFEGSSCIMVFTSINPQKLRSKIPSTVENYPVIIEETGTFHTLDTP